ncbi:alpha/beta hydrolase [Halalkalibaculum sp. DA3122]|uniref:alpha/beta hydrolase n=1 Tax=Halalkalibaculum sp. DA3122 TaxID=3373607 RepID=UPI003754C47A
MKKEVLTSGKASFKIEVPYKLIEVGEKGPRPLIIYLHGFGQNIGTFRKQVEGMLKINAFHLFIQGPYPIYERAKERTVDDWGRAWYLYDGTQAQFAKSLELGSEFVQQVVDKILNHIEVTRICIFGYSMGAYLAGFFALSRWMHVNELVMIGGRLKTELFEDREHHYRHLNMLALHGTRDDTVQAEPQEKSVTRLREWGANVSFIELEEGHRLTNAYIDAAKGWLEDGGYLLF